jgi:uncharacterized protein (TIGR02996 family)
MHEAFLQAILEAPTDDLPRLVYADWLDENGEHERAELIRLQPVGRQYQALDAAGQTAKLDLYVGMPHVFQGQLPDAPESKLAMRKMRDFLATHLGK